MFPISIDEGSLTVKEYGSTLQLSTILKNMRPENVFKNKLTLSIYSLEIDCQIKGLSIGSSKMNHTIDYEKA